MAVSDYLQYWPQIQAAFAGQGITLTLVQAEAIALQLLPLFQQLRPAPPPQSPPPPSPLPAVPQPWTMTVPVVPSKASGIFQPDLPAGAPAIAAEAVSGLLTFAVPAATLDSWGGSITISAPGYIDDVRRIVQPAEIQPPVVLQAVPAVASSPSPSSVLFDHEWTGKVELQFRALLASGLAGADGSNGQAVVNQMNALGGIYANGEFQPHHNGPAGLPTYGYPWFYVSYVPLSAGGGPIPNDGSGRSYYQIVEFGTPPAGN
jgi:hypothetical protein